MILRAWSRKHSRVSNANHKSDSSNISRLSKVCVLGQWEIDAWQQRDKRPSCSKHRHISQIDACSLTARGDSPNTCHYKATQAEWIGPGMKCIKFTSVITIRIVDRWRFPRAMLLQQGQRPYRYKTSELRSNAY